jgi:flagellar biosynthesis/type III secretory pathway M-ring protein FliF/YscJ
MPVELLLFILFLLFSVVSALLERRKRRRQLEQARQRQQERERRRQQEEARPAPAPRPTEAPEKEEEEVFGWPFGGDPFEEVRPPRPAPAPVVADLESERRALHRERQALEQERRIMEMERRLLQGARQEGRRTLREHPVHKPLPVQVGRWHLDPEKARDALVYAEILGPPKAERQESF